MYLIIEKEINTFMQIENKLRSVIKICTVNAVSSLI